MSIRDAVDFCELLVTDPEVRRRATALMKAGATADDLTGLGAVHGLDFTVAELEQASRSARELTEEELTAVSGGADDAQLANVDLQNTLQKQQQTLQMMSNISKMLYDSSQSIIRNIGG